MDDQQPKNLRKKKSPETRQWSLLAYIAGDNDLSDAGLEDIQEMCEEGAASSLHVGVEIDTLGEHTGSVRYEISAPDWSGRSHRTVIQRLSEKDTGDPDTLRDFLGWGLKRYPARKRLVVIWNHGLGFRTVRRNIAFDDYGSSLDMPEIVAAFRRAGLSRTNKLQILGFDACLMNMVEVVHHFRELVEIVVGSQQTEPGDGWPYDKVLKRAKQNPAPAELAAQIVREYIASYKRQHVAGVTQSAVRTAGTPAIIQALDRLGRLLAACLEAHRTAIRRARLGAQEFEAADYVDLVQVVEQLAKAIHDSEIRAAARAVVAAVRQAVIASSAFDAGSANGLSVWFPASAAEYFEFRAQYLRLDCNRTAFGWRLFLDAYHL